MQGDSNWDEGTGNSGMNVRDDAWDYSVLNDEGGMSDRPSEYAEPAPAKATPVAEASPAEEEPLHLALGLSKNLLSFKNALPYAKNYADLGLDPFLPAFKDHLLRNMELAEPIHFNLTEMTHLNTPDGVLKGPAEWNIPPSTNWELRTIWDTPHLKAKTDFYLLEGSILRQLLISEVEKLH